MSELILLFAAAFVAAALSGAAGFGGALLLLPVLVATLGVSLAVPLLTIAQLFGNLARVGFGLRRIHWRPVGFFLLGAVPGSVLGALFFLQLPKTLITRTIGICILIFVALHAAGSLHIKPGPWFLAVSGGIVGFLSGLAGSAGPLGAAVFLTLGLPPAAYIASEATTALVMHGVKMAIYQQTITLDRQFWWLALLMGVAMVLGTWSAKRVIEHLPTQRFHQLVSILLVVVAGYMVIHG